MAAIMLAITVTIDGIYSMGREGGDGVRESYRLLDTARRIASILNEEGIPICLIPEIFRLLEEDIKQHTIPYNPSCSQMNDLPTSDTESVRLLFDDQ